MARHEVFIPRWLPTPLNKLKRHWSVAHRLKKADREMVMAYAHKHKTPLARVKRRITFTLILPPGQRRTDPDSPLKSGLDACVHAGLLHDDSDKWVEIQPVVFVRGTEERWGTILILEDMA